MKNKHTTKIFILFYFLSITSLYCQVTPSKGVLFVKNIQKIKGTIIVRLYRKEDDLKGEPYLQQITIITSNTTSVEFNDSTYSRYVAFAFHDENNNSTLDHNWMGIPTEPMGYSNNWNFNLLIGMPTYNKTNFYSLKKKYNHNKSNLK